MLAMRRIQKRCKSSRALAKLRDQLGKCQGFLGDPEQQSLAQVLGAQGGLPPGQGSVESPNDQQDPEFEGGADQLKGQKGSGPSAVSVESAESGSGVSGVRSARRARDFQRQVESFVEREDVPEDLKSGVKTYFEHIHRQPASDGAAETDGTDP